MDLDNLDEYELVEVRGEESYAVGKGRGQPPRIGERIELDINARNIITRRGYEVVDVVHRLSTNQEPGPETEIIRREVYVIVKSAKKRK